MRRGGVSRGKKTVSDGQDGRSRETEEFVLLIQTTIGILGRSGRMTKRMWDVFAVVIAQCQYGNRVSVNQSRLARALQTNRTVVNRAIRQLERLQILKKEVREGCHPEFYLNPDLAIKARTNGDRQRIHARFGRAIAGPDARPVPALYPGPDAEEADE